MWLYRAMPILSELATRAYYRVTVAGGRLPSHGPVLIVANHNNSLVDPALVAATAGRDVRFLAKSTLFTHPIIGWLVKGVGSVPVYRQQDDPSKLSQNLDSFRDVHKVLAAGDVVGIFPEGISHSASSLAPLKTGAARIAIGAAAHIGHDFPVIAVGLVFRDRDAFRSEAHVIIADPFPWNDLVGDLTNRSAVREMTERIEQAMRRVSVNLEQWEDEPLVRTAEEVWRAQFGADASPAAEVERLRVIASELALLRRGGDESWRETAVELRGHGRALRAMELTPDTLLENVTAASAAVWLLARLPILVLLPISLLGGVFFWFPKWLTVRVAARIAASEGDDALVTHRVLTGAVAFPLWAVLTAVPVAWRFGALAGLAFAVLQPFWAFAALAVGERRQRIWRAVRRHVLRARMRPRLDQLRERQARLATRLRELLAAADARR